MKVAAYVCLILAALTAPLSVVLIGLNAALLDSQAWKRAVESEGIYVRLPGLASAVVADLADEPGSPLAPLKDLPEGSLDKFLGQAVPAEAYETRLCRLIEDGLTFLQADGQVVEISLQPLQQAFAGPQGLEMANAILDAQPDCTFDELAFLATETWFDTQGRLVLCNPPREYFDASGSHVFAEIIPGMVASASQMIPERMVVVERSVELSSALERFDAARRPIQWGWLVPAVLLLLGTLLIVRSFSGWLIHWGWSILLAGLWGLLLTVVAAPALMPLARETMLVALRAFPQALAEPAWSVLAAVLSSTLRPLATRFAMAGGAGLAVFALGWLLRPRPVVRAS